MNNVQILGRISNDLEVKTSGSVTYINFDVACQVTKEKTMFIPVTAFGKTAENIGKYFAKGQRILINGSIDVSTYTDKNGNNVKSVKVVVTNFDFIETKEK